MIIGFGFGSPLVALLMLVVTGFMSYFLFKFLKNVNRSSWREEPAETDIEREKEIRRQYYYEQRKKAREMLEKYDLTDEEIEEIVEQEFTK